MSDADDAPTAIDGKVWVRLLNDEEKDVRADMMPSNQERGNDETKSDRQAATSFNVQLIE